MKDRPRDKQVGRQRVRGKEMGGGGRESMYVHIYGCIVVKLNQLLQRDFHRHSVVKEPSLGQSDQYIYIKKTQRALKF